MGLYFVSQATRCLKLRSSVHINRQSRASENNVHQQLKGQWTQLCNWAQGHRTPPLKKNTQDGQSKILGLSLTSQISHLSKYKNSLEQRLLSSRGFHHEPDWNFNQYRSCHQKSHCDISAEETSINRGCKQSRHKSKRPPRTTFRRWTNFFLYLAPVGILVFGAIQWKRSQTYATATQFQTFIYCSLPLRIVSRCWGWLASCYMPKPFRPYVYGWYAQAFNVNLDEALYPDLLHYNSMAEFFTRPLKVDSRPIDTSAILVSPADGKVLHFGRASENMIEQVKGITYDIHHFLGPPTWLDELEASERELPKESSIANNNTNTTKDGNIKMTGTNENYTQRIKYYKDGSTSLYQCVIYLAPGDYHRFHSPTDWQLIYRRHFHGELLSVNPAIVNWLPGLFSLNERVVYAGNWKYGFFSYTAVGATNVGSMQIFFDQELKTNRWWTNPFREVNPYNDLKLGDKIGEKSLVRKGDLFGQFNMGSTIVLLFEAPNDFRFNLSIGQRLRMGQSLTSNKPF